MQLGERISDDAAFQDKDKLSQLHLRLRQLVEQVEQIQKEQEYQRVSDRWYDPVSLPGYGSPTSFPPFPFRSSSLPPSHPSSFPQWREERFRQTSESTNQRVLGWSILQTLILLAIGIWQMQHLKGFFKAKKLV